MTPEQNPPTMVDFNKAIFPGLETDRSAWGDPSDCGCWTCVSGRVSESNHPWSMPFIVCDLCGNKRCPRATHHDQACTDSNDPQQSGSRYGGKAASPDEPCYCGECPDCRSEGEKYLATLPPGLAQRLRDLRKKEEE